MLSGTVRNLIVSGKLMTKKGKYIPHMSVDVYDDGAVVMWNDGTAYDGCVDNLQAFCKENNAIVVNELPPVRKEPPTEAHTEDRSLARKDEAADIPAVGTDSKVEDSEDTLRSVTKEYLIEPTKPLKAGEARAYNDLLPEEVKADNESGGLVLRARYAEATNLAYSIAIRCWMEGRKVNHEAIRKILPTRDKAKTEPIIPGKENRSGGTFEDFLKKFRSTPHEQLFTEDASILFPNQREWEIEHAAAVARSEMFSSYAQAVT
jgi:hypothetical protein